MFKRLMRAVETEKLSPPAENAVIARPATIAQR